MAFAGFTSAAADFFDRLAGNNTKAYFERHRSEYDDLIRAPLLELLAEMEDDHGPGRVTRPHRDLRFTPDKRPYRLDAGVWAGRTSGIYLGLSADGLQVGGGLYEPTRDQLRDARAAIAEQPAVAGVLRRAVNRLTAIGFEFAGPPLKTAPRGFDRDHPAVDLLRMTHYAAAVHLEVEASPDEIREAWRQTASLNNWIDRHAVGSGGSG